MTTLTMRSVPVHLEEDEKLQPLPWRRMAWVTWRQHRVALVGLAILLGAIAVYLWLQGRQMHQAYGTALACHPASSGTCMNASNYFTNRYDLARKITPLVLQAVPAIVGAFLGAPVLARELETGTFRCAWTQGFGRSRWTLAKLVSLAVLAAAAAELFSLLFSWYYQPFFADDQANSLAASAFNLRGITFAFWTLVAFAIGGFAGVLIRRVVPALVATLVTYAGLVLVVGVFLRQHYLTPLIARQQSLTVADLVTGNWGMKGGRPVFSFTGEPTPSVLGQFCPSGATVKPSTGVVGGFARCLSQHGYTLWANYQPASRFWPFQWIESGWLLALSALLIAATVWVVRRRVG
jgi:ABC-2 family transporter protein